MYIYSKIKKKFNRKKYTRYFVFFLCAENNPKQKCFLRAFASSKNTENNNHSRMFMRDRRKRYLLGIYLIKTIYTMTCVSRRSMIVFAQSYIYMPWNLEGSAIEWVLYTCVVCVHERDSWARSRNWFSV